MTMTRRLGVILLLVLVVGPSVRAEMTDSQLRAVIEEGLTAYEQGIALRRTDPERSHEHFVEATARFQQAIDAGLDGGALYYNLGNAWFQAGELGRAIAAYRAAERSVSGNPRLQHNLEYARSLRRNQITPSGRRALGDALLSWHRRISLGVRLGVFLVAWVAVWIIVLAWIIRPGRIWFWPFISGMLLSIIVGMSVWWDLHGPRTVEGVVIADDVIVRKGHGDGYERQFEEPLHEGVEFRLIEERGDWVQIEIVDGSRGWVRTEQVVLQ